jgi:hypothetical protein
VADQRNWMVLSIPKIFAKGVPAQTRFSMSSAGCTDENWLNKVQ